MARSRFAKNHIYYNSEDGYKLRYIEEDREGYYHFKIVEHDDPENDWAEYSTRDGDEIVKTEKEIEDAIRRTE